MTFSGTWERSKLPGTIGCVRRENVDGTVNWIYIHPGMVADDVSFRKGDEVEIFVRRASENVGDAHKDGEQHQDDDHHDE